MARVYMITEDEMSQLLNDLVLEKLISSNICDPYRRLDEGVKLDDQQKAKLRPIVQSVHAGFHMVVMRWADQIGFSGTDYWKKMRS